MAPSSQCRCHCANIKVYRVDSLTSCHLVVVGTTSVVLQQWQYGVVWCRPKVSDVVQMEPGREPFSSKKRCRSIFECGWRSEIISNRVEIVEISPTSYQIQCVTLDLVIYAKAIRLWCCFEAKPDCPVIADQSSHIWLALYLLPSNDACCLFCTSHGTSFG